MKIQIDIKSAAIGLFIGAAVMFTLGNSTRPNENGRYYVSSGDKFAIIIDSQTGEAWGHAADNDGENGKEAQSNFWDPKSHGN